MNVAAHTMAVAARGAARSQRGVMPLLWRPVVAKRGCRAFCTADEDKYLELKQLRDIKSEAFYDQQNQHRRYFYYVDLQGRLFLEDTRPKNIATSLKSAKFLRFFFSQVRPNTPAECQSPEEEAFLEYPFRSPCGKEMNFIKCADRPFVFEDLKQSGGENKDKGATNWKLVYGGGELAMPFRPETLRISLSTGRLYHDLQTKLVKPGTPEGIALVKSQLAVELAKNIELRDMPDEDDTEENVDELVIGDFVWEDKRYAIHAIE